MLNFIAYRLTLHTFSFLELSLIQIEQISYVLEVLITDLSKIIIIVLVCKTLGLNNHVLIIWLYSIPLRTQIGGFHFKKYFHCLLFSFFYCITIYFASNYVILSFVILLVAAISCSLMIVLNAPIIPHQRLNCKSVGCKLYKRNSLFLLVLYLLIFINKNNPYSRYGIWVIIIQTILLLLAKEKNIYEEKLLQKITSIAQ